MLSAEVKAALDEAFRQGGWLEPTPEKGGHEWACFEVDAIRALVPAVEQIARTHAADAVARFKAEAVAAIEVEREVAFVVNEGSGWSHAITRTARIVANLTPSDP